MSLTVNPSQSTTPRYQPVDIRPQPGDQTPGLEAILKEIRQGCPNGQKELDEAQRLQDFYDGESEKHIPMRPEEDGKSWYDRPKRVSFILRQAVTKLTSQLYKPGPRFRRIVDDPDLTIWYERVCKDIQLNGVMQQADRLATLHGICTIGIYPTGNPSRPINYHLFPRQDFLFWTSPDDPRVAIAVCIVTRSDPQTIRYRLWTASHFYTFFKGKLWGYVPGGWNVARYDPSQSGPHPYGVLPFVFITHELPTTQLATPGLGTLLEKINKALNTDKSNLALWVHIYARPIGFVSGVSAEWKPKRVDGGFVPLAVRHDSTEDSPVIPEARYLESSIDIDAIRRYIAGEANEALAELDIPITINVSSEQAGSGGVSMASGVSIAAQGADLITYAKGRQPLFEVHETHLASLVAQVASTLPGGSGAPAASLTRVAFDMQLRVAWPEPAIDLPGPERDTADTFELTNDLTDPIELLMRRRGLTMDEAIEEYRKIQRRKAIAVEIQSDPDADLAAYLTPEPPPVPAGAAPGFIPPDMGVPAAASPQGTLAGSNVIIPGATMTVAVPPNEPLPLDGRLTAGVDRER